MKSLEEPPSEVGREVLCAMINNNLRCYDLALELSTTTLVALPENYAEQAYVNYIDFDYKEYTRQRSEQYWLRKAEILNVQDDDGSTNV